MVGRGLCWIAVIWISFGLLAAEAGGVDGPQLRLIGTVRGAGGGIAVCLDPATAQPFSLRVGENFNGWELLSVGAERAVFAKSGSSTRAIVTIDAPANNAASAPPPQPPVAAPQPATVQSPRTSQPRNGTWMDGDGQMIDPPVRK